MNQHQTPRNLRAGKLLRLGVLRAGFALGGHLAPRRTVDRAATPFPLLRLPAVAHERAPYELTAKMQRHELKIKGQTIALYVWGDPAQEPYALLAHGWSSFGLRFLPWVQRLRAAGFAVVTFDQPGHGFSSGELCTLPDFVHTIRAIRQPLRKSGAGDRAFSRGCRGDTRAGRRVARCASCHHRAARKHGSRRRAVHALRPPRLSPPRAIPRLARAGHWREGARSGRAPSCARSRATLFDSA